MLEHVNESRSEKQILSISSIVLWITDPLELNQRKCVQISLKRRLRKYIQKWTRFKGGKGKANSLAK